MRLIITAIIANIAADSERANSLLPPIVKNLQKLTFLLPKCAFCLVIIPGRVTI
jgi:hypothetical protein